VGEVTGGRTRLRSKDVAPADNAQENARRQCCESRSDVPVVALTERAPDEIEVDVTDSNVREDDRDEDARPREQPPEAKPGESHAAGPESGPEPVVSAEEKFTVLKYAALLLALRSRVARR